MAAGRAAPGDLLRHVGAVHHRLPQGRSDPGPDHDLGALAVVGSTGSPLDAEGFGWLHDAVGERIQIVSLSGGTDLCTAIVGGAPTVPVWAGEISCRALGARVEAYSPDR